MSAETASFGRIAVTGAEMALAREWAAARFEIASEEPPFSFVYDGRPSSEFLKDWRVERKARDLDKDRIERTIVWTDPATGLSVRCAAIEYRDFPTVEWTLRFGNGGRADTPIVSDILAMDASFARTPEREFALHHATGSPARAYDYQPLRTDLYRGTTTRIATCGGRGSDSDMPYFNLEWGGAGVIFVVGWPGQWAAQFARDRETNLRVRAGQEQTRFTLHPGEEVRSPLIVLQFWKGGDWLRAQNLWRRWMIAHNIPRPGGELPKPFMPAGSSSQFSEMENANEENQKRFIDRYLEEGVEFDLWWMDAGWYTTKSGKWWDVGTWEVDTKRFPRGLRAVSDHAHAKGLRCLVWFEPERVRPGSWLYENHPEWLLGVDGEQKLLDLGNPEARAWVVDHFDKIVGEQGIDLYRQDFNFAPLPYWRANDAPDRQGISEIRHVTGYLAFWDELRRRHPDKLIDTCASGGRRNDLETLRRSVPLHKSDHDYSDYAARQCQHYGLALWSPFFGSSVCRLDRVDAYAFRSGYAPMTGLGFDVRRTDLDYKLMAKLAKEWRRLKDYWYGDFWPLTSYSFDQGSWIAWQYDRPDLGEGVVQAFRRAESPYETANLRLRGLDPEASYEFSDLDSGGATRASGRDLMEKGLPVTMVERPQARVFVYRKK